MQSSENKEILAINKALIRVKERSRFLARGRNMFDETPRIGQWTLNIFTSPDFQDINNAMNEEVANESVTVARSVKGNIVDIQIARIPRFVSEEGERGKDRVRSREEMPMRGG
jgi:hypothetical protein